MKIYVVKQGDSVDSIAESQGIPVETLVWANQIEYPYRLAVGQALYISDGETGEGRRPLFSSGYAYPFIDSGVLEDTLPYLSAINVFSYGFTEDGNLVLPMTDDAWMIERALQWGVRPVLTLTPLGEDGHFNNNLVSALGGAAHKISILHPVFRQHILKVNVQALVSLFLHGASQLPYKTLLVFLASHQG